ncbi:MAG TPA: class I SAM-dependent methyltransferase [Longimicrobiales bacterium]
MAREACPACGGAALGLLFAKDGYPILECGACGLVFHPAEPAAESIAEMYSAAYFTEGAYNGYPDYVGDGAVHRRQARYYLRQLAKCGATGGSLLDVGCAAGFFLDEAARAGWRVAGCDVSDYATRHAREVLGLDVVCADFLDADLGDRTFDVVTMLNVFEHLPEPAAVMARLTALVKPGGLLLIETWDRSSMVARLLGRRWHQYAPPSVLFFYDRASLCRLFDARQWRLVRYRPSLKWISLTHGLAVLADGARPTWKRRFARMFMASPLGDIQVPYMFGDLVLATFQRS